MSSHSLPIDELLPELKKTLSEYRRVVLQAPPGAGKTTRVPLALLEDKWLSGKSILMLEPRRLAAVNASEFMARLRNEPVGRSVGFSIRYQRKVSPNTRIEVVTEGILTRRLQQDPELRRVGLVIFDEFHERHLQSDLSLALCCDIQQAMREDLRLLIMSATLDGAPLARLLKAPLLTSEGRSFPVSISYRPVPPKLPLAEATANACRRALEEESGDLLAFLPGEGEIRHCQQALGDLSERLDIRPLYAALPFTEQQKAILPGSRRRLVLATNIAETSLTIEGVRLVIDSGYCRRPNYLPGKGLTQIGLCRISRASAEQRAGRAGRLEPGHCIRLWSEGTQGTLLPFTPPEIRSADLSPLALELLSWGVNDPSQLTWLDPPPASAWAAGLELLSLLGCWSPQLLQLTPQGRRAAELPTHPRLACLLLEAEKQGRLDLGCDLVALLAEADPWFKQPPPNLSSSSDLLDRLQALWQNRHSGQLKEFSAVDRAACYWREYFRLSKKFISGKDVDHLDLAPFLMAAYPDRLGSQRSDNNRHYLLSSGQGAQLDQRSALIPTGYLIAVELQDGRGSSEAHIRLANSVDKEAILQYFPDLPWLHQLCWNETEGRISSLSQQRLGELVLAEKQVTAKPEEIQQLWREVLQKEGLKMLSFSAEAKSFLARGRFVQKYLPENAWPDLSEAELLANLDNWLLPSIGQVRSLTDLHKLDLLSSLRSCFSWQQLQQLDRHAPERLAVPSGSRIRLDYPAEGPPVLAVKLQEMFGLTRTPTIAAGRCPLQIHLLSPAGRPLQITQDLAHFWIHSYPEVRKEMKGRYPKHPWPENPLEALPTAKTKRRLSVQEFPEP